MPTKTLKLASIVCFAVAMSGLLIGGLLTMTLTTLFPLGIAQAWTSYREGLWLARDVSYFERPMVALPGQLRIVPDAMIILFGVLPLCLLPIQNLSAPEGTGDQRWGIGVGSAGYKTIIGLPAVCGARRLWWAPQEPAARKHHPAPR